MSDEVLKPCPICGKKVSIARTDNEFGERWWFITRGTYRTTRCNCRLFLESEKFTCGWNEDHSLECRAKLIDKWNTRAELGSEPPYDELLRYLANDWHISASWDGLRKFWSIELTEEGVKLRDATHGTLTAEQVREAIEKRFDFDVWVPAARWQAIADELNAKLGSGTCEPELTVYNEASDDELFRCSYCHCKVYNIDMTEGDCGWGFTFCPQCGGEVYESDSRKIEAKLDETTNGIGGETNGIHADAPLVDGDAVSIMRDLRGCVDVPMLKDTLCRETGTDNLVDALETLADMIERDYVSRQDFAAQHRTLCGVREQRDEAREQVDAMRDVVRDFLDERDEWKTKFEAREFAYKQADAERKRYSEQIDELIAEIGSGTCKVECFDDGVDEGLDGEWFSYAPPTWYLSCGHTAQGTERPNFCPVCGKAVKR